MMGSRSWGKEEKASAVGSADLWIASLGVSAPNIPDPPWTDWRLWQYSDSRLVPGVSGRVDADKFNGSLLDLEAYASPAPDPGSSLSLLLMAVGGLALTRRKAG